MLYRLVDYQNILIPNTQVYLNLRLLNVGIGFTPVIVTETYTAIKTILDSIDCTKLCTDT